MGGARCVVAPAASAARFRPQRLHLALRLRRQAAVAQPFQRNPPQRLFVAAVEEREVADLPLSCPMPEMVLWNSHPRVYLPIEQTGSAKCPYCGTEYTLRR